VAILLIEYQVDDFAEWKAVFDRDPMGRGDHGVTGHRIYQDPDDLNHIMLSLEFSSTDQANAFREVLQPVWGVSSAGQGWILREAEAVAY
jgi:hypothetical protein